MRKPLWRQIRDSQRLYLLYCKSVVCAVPRSDAHSSGRRERLFGVAEKALPCAGTCFSALRNSVFCCAGKAFLCRPDGVKALAEGRGGGGKGFFVCGGTPDVTLRFSLS